MIEMISERSILRHTDAAGKQHYLAQLIADTAAELAGVTGQGSVVWDYGSLALTADGEVCILDSSGVWHKSDGSAIAAASGTEEEVNGDG